MPARSRAAAEAAAVPTGGMRAVRGAHEVDESVRIASLSSSSNLAFRDDKEETDTSRVGDRQSESADAAFGERQGQIDSRLRTAVSSAGRAESLGF